MVNKFYFKAYFKWGILMAHYDSQTKIKSIEEYVWL